jgi:HEAT repeat protein
MAKIEELRNKEEYSLLNLPELIKSEDENVRKEAENILALKKRDFSKIDELRKRGDKEISELLKFLDNEDRDVQWHAQYALEKIGKEHPKKENVRKLIKLLGDREKSVQIGAVLALAESPPNLAKIKNASHKLVRSLNNENWFVRKEVACILGRIASYYPKKVKKASHKLMEMLNDEKEIVQAYAIDALGGIAKEYPEEVDISYFHKLPELLDSNDVNIRYMTVSAIDKIAGTHPEKVMNTSHKLVGLLKKGDIRATSALTNISKADSKIAENISQELKGLLDDENTVNKEEVNRTLKSIIKVRHEKIKKENKIPSGLGMVLLFSAFFGLLTFGRYILTFQLANTLFELDPTLFIRNSCLSLTGFLLILSAVGLWLQKKVGYWGIIFGWIPIMFFGLYYIYHVIEVGPGSALRPIATTVGFILFGLLPITIIFYMLAEKKKIENWVEIESPYQFEKLVGIFSAFLVFLGILGTLNYAILFKTALIDSSSVLVAVISIIDFLIAYFISFYVYDITTDYLIKMKSKRTF